MHTHRFCSVRFSLEFDLNILSFRDILYDILSVPTRLPR